MISSPYEHFKESGTDLPYPHDHHAEDIHAIKQVIETNNSLLVLGLSGFGKSSVLRFLVSNPAVQSDDMVLIYIDCNEISWDKKKEAIQEEIFSLIVERLMTQWPSVWPIGRAKPVLRRLMEELSREGPAHLAIIFDRSELLQQELGEIFFNHLRALRDTNSRLSYIFSGRHLRSEDFGELADILWDEPHWIGALSYEGAEMTVHRHLTRLGIRLEAEQVKKLVKCVGYHPQLLKYTCELVRANKIGVDGDETEVIRQLITTQRIEYQCRDLWQDLNFEAQSTLRQIVLGEKDLLTATIEWLKRSGILYQAKDGNVEFTSPVFKRYVSILGPPPITVDKGIVFKGAAELILSKEEFDLLKVLWDNQPQVVSSDQICEAVWPHEQWEVSLQMITNLVKRLRDKLRDKSYINNVRGRGYQFIQGTAPLPRG